MLIVVDGDVSMSYEHKSKLSSRNPKSILTNIMQTGEEEYELDIIPITREQSNDQDEARKENANHLPKIADIIITEIDNTLVPGKTALETDEGKVERYNDEINFDPEEPKRAFEKKRKGRDYIEFRDQC